MQKKQINLEKCVGGGVILHINNHCFMKKILLVFLTVLISTAVNAQITLAVMDFKPGSNMNSNLDGLSDMLINSLFDSGNYDIVERSQIESALTELGIQGKNLSVTQLTKLGEYLKVDNVLVGTVNFIATGNSADPGFQTGEYNIDVRIVDVKTSRIIATAGVVKDCNQTYRSLMPELARQLSGKLMTASIPKLQGYLYVYPERMSYITYQGAMDLVRHLNSINAYGKNSWRVPTEDEARSIYYCEDEQIINITTDSDGNRSSLWTSTHGEASQRYGSDIHRVRGHVVINDNSRIYSDKNRFLIVPVSTD